MVGAKLKTILLLAGRDMAANGLRDKRPSSYPSNGAMACADAGGIDPVPFQAAVRTGSTHRHQLFDSTLGIDLHNDKLWRWKDSVDCSHFIKREHKAILLTW